MPWPGQPTSAPAPAGPALFLYPTNDSFIPKMISLAPSGNRVKIGRQTNNKTVPGERNGYFDSKVLSRQHAEVWEENGKIFIKDVRSSNGTFVNGERLSVEGMESDPWELKSDDRVEFGIDIVGEDNKTIIHHKVAATVFCVITAEDYAQLNMHHPPPQQHHAGHQNGAYLQVGQQRRPSLQQAQSPIGLGGLGGGPALGLSGRSGKSGLTFDHILSRLQNELQKSRETGSELNTLATVMTDINENLVGGAHPPSHNPHVPLPPVRPPVAPQSVSPVPASAPSPPSPDTSANLSALQSQLIQTQSVLANHADKVKTFEGIIAEHENVKHEVQLMRDLMEQRKLEMESFISTSRMRSPESESNQLTNHLQITDGEIQEEQDDDSDTRSILTMVPEDAGAMGNADDEETYQHETNGSQYQDDEDDRRARTDAMDRPRTPEPHGIHDEDDDDFSSDDEAHPTIRHKHFVESSLPVPPKYPSVPYPSPSSPPRGSSIPLVVPPSEPTSSPSAEFTPSPDVTTEDLHSQNSFLTSRLETLALQLDTALSLSRTLHDSATAAHTNIEKLEAKVKSLEAFVETTKAQQEQEREERAREEERKREEEEAALAAAAASAALVAAAAAAATDDSENASDDGNVPSAPSTDVSVQDATPHLDQASSASDGPDPVAAPQPEPVQPQILLTELWESWRTRIEGQWRTEREEWEVERVRLQAAVREWQDRMATLATSDQKRTTDGEELIREMRRDREEAVELWKQQQAQIQAQIQAQSELIQSAQSAQQHRNGGNRYEAVPLSSDDESEVKPRIPNGVPVTKKAGRRQSDPAKNRKQRRSSQTLVTTPPVSPTLVNTGPSGSAAELSSAEESTSPDLAIPGGIRREDIFMNVLGKKSKAKAQILPLSPAPSIAQDGTVTREGSSAASDPDSATLVNDDASSVGTVAGIFSGKSNGYAGLGRTRRLHESPMPYISASVVFIGLAAWAFASRTKD